jgi:hypothetical protein
MYAPDRFQKIHFCVPKFWTQGLIPKGLNGCRLRGVWRNAQDTVPIRACFFSKIKRLSILPAVDGLSTVFVFQKIINKNSEQGE